MTLHSCFRMHSSRGILRAPLRLLLNASSLSGIRTSAVAKDVWWATIRNGISPPIQAGVRLDYRYYVRNPLERLPMEHLKGSVGGGRGGRGGRGRKRGGKKGMRDTQAIWIGQGKDGERWPGLSYPLEKVKYSLDWLQKNKLGMKIVEESSENVSESWGGREEEMNDNMVRLRLIEGKKREVRRISEMGWDKKGWSGVQLDGRYVGCPELPDGTPLEDFRSVVIEVKRVANQTRGGKKRTISALVVVGNGNGMAGFAVGRGEELKAALRKAKNKAVNYLQFIPRCDDHTIFHNVKVKYCKTNIEMERRVRGHGLRCHRAVSAICKLAGIQDMRAKVTGSNNPLNTVRAAFKALTSQESFQQLADKTGQFVVEYRRECFDRPVVVAMPTTQPQDKENILYELREQQMIANSLSLQS